VTGPEALTVLENLGVTFRPAPDGRLLAKLPGRLPEDARVLLDDVRRDRDEALRLLLARSHLCVDCRAEVGPTLILCASCYEARTERRKIIPFDPERRKSAVLRAYFSKCSSCGRSWWGFNARGDAWCIWCWRDARKNLVTLPRAARSPEGPGSAIRPETTGQGGAA
jgi:hypothetical protein